MSRIQNPAPDATRRRASTNRKMETIMRLARRLPLTRQVLADQLETATQVLGQIFRKYLMELQSTDARSPFSPLP